MSVLNFTFNLIEISIQKQEKEREDLKSAHETIRRRNNEQVSELVRQIVYLRKRLEIQKLQQPSLTHVHNLNQDQDREKTPRKKRSRGDKKSLKNTKQFSI